MARSAQLTKAALRGLQMPREEMLERLQSASEDTAKALNDEMTWIDAVKASYLIWKEQGVWDDILRYLEEDVRDGVSVREVPSEAA